MPLSTIPEPLPFGIRRTPEPESMKLSSLELLLVAFAISALIHLGSLGPSTEDPWMKPPKPNSKRARPQLNRSAAISPPPNIKDRKIYINAMR